MNTTNFHSYCYYLTFPLLSLSSQIIKILYRASSEYIECPKKNPEQFSGKRSRAVTSCLASFRCCRFQTAQTLGFHWAKNISETGVMIGMPAGQDRREWRVVRLGVGTFCLECQINPTQPTSFSQWPLRRRAGGEF